MRNFKKLVAMGTALAMAMIMSISAFAAAGDSVNEPITDAYADGAVVVSAIKDALPAMVEGAQYTVVVVPVGEEITDSNIYYINQADGADNVWATTTTWGTPTTLADGDYVVRVGDEAGNVDETYFRIGSTEEPPVQEGPKVTFMNGTTTVETVASVDGKIVLTETVPTLEATEGYVTPAYAFVEWVKEDGTAIAEGADITEDLTVYPKYKGQVIVETVAKDLVYGDVNLDGIADITDSSQIIRKIKGRSAQQTGLPASPLYNLTIEGQEKAYLIGDVNLDGIADITDSSQIIRKIKGRSAQETGKIIYVINK